MIERWFDRGRDQWRICAALLALSVIISPLAHSFDTRAQFAYMIDLQSKSVLYEKKANERIIPASMTKIMTTYLAIEALTEGKIHMEDVFKTSKRAYDMPGSRSFLEIDQEVTVADLLLGVVVQSGNDAAVVLAEGIAGSENEFAARMTEASRRIGTTDTQFRNASGLPEEGHFSTVKDIALISLNLIEKFPSLYSIHQEKSFTLNGIRQGNRNLLIGKVEGVDGIKTGHTFASGYGAAVSALRNGRRIVAVAHGMENEIERKRELERMLEWGFRAWDNIQVYQPNDTVHSLPVLLGKKKLVELIVRDSVYVSLPSDGTLKPRFVLKYLDPIPAPVNTEDPLAKLLIAVGTQERNIDLYARLPIDRGGFLSQLWFNARSMIGAGPS